MNITEQPHDTQAGFTYLGETWKGVCLFPDDMDFFDIVPLLNREREGVTGYSHSAFYRRAEQAGLELCDVFMRVRDGALVVPCQYELFVLDTSLAVREDGHRNVARRKVAELERRIAVACDFDGTER